VKELSCRHRDECELATEKLRSAQVHAEKLFTARDRVNKEHVRGLQDQVIKQLSYWLPS